VKLKLPEDVTVIQGVKADKIWCFCQLIPNLFLFLSVSSLRSLLRLPAVELVIRYAWRWT
jgi:hypothetical protein